MEKQKIVKSLYITKENLDKLKAEAERINVSVNALIFMRLFGDRAFLGGERL